MSAPRATGAAAFAEWLSEGVRRGWVSEPNCDTHDGPNMTEEEAEAWEEGRDPCMVSMRVWVT